MKVQNVGVDSTVLNQSSGFETDYKHNAPMLRTEKSRMSWRIAQRAVEAKSRADVPALVEQATAVIPGDHAFSSKIFERLMGWGYFDVAREVARDYVSGADLDAGVLSVIAYGLVTQSKASSVEPATSKRACTET